MGIYSDLTDSELSALRTRLRDSLHDRLTAPTLAMSKDRRAEYQQNPDQIRAALAEVNAEIGRRACTPARAPIYLT